MIDRRPRIPRSASVPRTARSLELERGWQIRLGRVRRRQQWAGSIARRWTRIHRFASRSALVFRQHPSVQLSATVPRSLRRTSVFAPTYAPRLTLSISPRLVLAARQPEHRRSTLPKAHRLVPCDTASAAATSTVPARVERPAPMVLVLARTSAPAGAAGAMGPRGRSGPAARTTVIGRGWTQRLVERGRRTERRPARTPVRVFHAAPASPAPAALETHASQSQRQVALGGHRPAAAPGGGRDRSALPALAQSPAEGALPSAQQLERLTDQVVHRIDRRLTAWRERTGRV